VKKIILSVLMAAMSTGAMAEWVGYAESKTTAFYLDPATIRKDDNFRKVWSVQDLKQRHKNGEMSLRLLQEFDCKEDRFRILSYSKHSGPMVSGEILGSQSSPSKWEYIPPETISNTLLEIVCRQ